MPIDELVVGPVIVFMLSLVVAGILYIVGGSIAVKSKRNPNKSKPYACGQDVPAERTPVIIWLFKFATAFLVIDVVAYLFILSMGASFASPVRELILVYSVVTLIALITLVRR
ncbi:MAG: NADH-quinone oxidoreductase subunit A [Candidatus Bathyarchaeia archaeon]